MKRTNSTTERFSFLNNFILLVLFLFPLTVFSYTGEVTDSLKTPGDYPSGLTFDGKYLWVTDFKTDSIYCLDTKGKRITQFSSPAYWPSGLAFDGKYLWNSDIKGSIPQGDEYYSGKIYKIDPADGTVLKTLTAPTSSPIGLTWDGQYLWCVDDMAKMLIQFDPEDGTTINEFKSPSSAPQGITFDGKYLWVSDRKKDEIYMVEPSTGDVIIIAKAPGGYSRDLCYDGENLWNVDFISKKIYKLNIRDDEKYLRSEEKKGKITYTHLTTNFGPGTIKKIDIHFALPANRPNQVIESDFHYSPNVKDIPEDQWGQKTAHFQFNSIPPGQRREINIDFDVTTYDVRYFIYPEKVGEMDDIPNEINERFLKDNSKYDMKNPVIQKAVKEALGNEKNPYWKVRKIFNYLIANMEYKRVGGWNTAPTVLARGNGSCSEYTFVFISMCHSAGIPARYVGTIVRRGDDRSIDDVFHRWVEFYLPGYGWVPIDPSGGDRDSPRDQANYIGHLANRYVITTQGGGNSKSMGWNYNSNDYYVTDPKTNVAIEYFGEWHE